MAGLDAAGIQQAIGLAKGQAIKIIGGVPILKNALGSTLEKLKLPKHLDVGNVGALLGLVQSGGIGALLQNPVGAATAALGGAIASAGTALASAMGSAAGPLTSALGDLQGSLGALSSLAGNLAGATSAPGLPDNLDLVAHASLAGSFGDALPSSLGLAAATAPMTASAMLADLGGAAPARRGPAASARRAAQGPRRPQHPARYDPGAAEAPGRARARAPPCAGVGVRALTPRSYPRSSPQPHRPPGWWGFRRLRVSTG